MNLGHVVSFKLNQPTSVPPLVINDIGYFLSLIEGPTAGHVFKKFHTPQIWSSHLFDQTSISRPINSNAYSLVSLINHETIWSKAHRHISTYFPQMVHIIKWQDKAATTAEKTMDGTSASSTLTLTTNIIPSKRATVTVKYSDDMDNNSHRNLHQGHPR